MAVPFSTHVFVVGVPVFIAGAAILVWFLGSGAWRRAG